MKTPTRAFYTIFISHDISTFLFPLLFITRLMTRDCIDLIFLVDDISSCDQKEWVTDGPQVPGWNWEHLFCGKLTLANQHLHFYCVVLLTVGFMFNNLFATRLPVSAGNTSTTRRAGVVEDGFLKQTNLDRGLDSTPAPFIWKVQLRVGLLVWANTCRGSGTL